MNTTEWSALATFFVLSMSTTTGAAVAIIRAINRVREDARDRLEQHTINCANYEPNTGVRVQLISKKKRKHA